MRTKNKDKELNHRHFIGLRLTDVELDLLDQGAACLSISRSEYLRKLLLEKQIHHQIEVVADMNDLRKLVSEYGKIGSNLNQIAKHFNSGDMQAYYVDRFGFAELPDFAAQREKILDIVPEIENVDYENDLTCISFYAAECAEFPVMGEVHYDLTLPEALDAYEKIPSERMHGLKCVGFDLKDGSDYEGMQSLMIEGKIQKEFLNSIPGFRENSYVQNAISRVEKYMAEKHPSVDNSLNSKHKGEKSKKTKDEKELNIQMKPIPKKKRGEMSL